MPAVEPAASILIVDDDETFRRRMARAFEERGFDVRTAASYDEAVDAARQDSPQLALVDLKMPGRSGIDLVRELKSIDETTNVVVLTGYGSIATAIEAIRLGASHYLSKPADLDDIVQAFNRDPNTTLPVGVTEPEVPSLARVEWEHIQRVLTDCGGNVSEAARRLRMHRRSLQLKLRKNPPGR
jgi:two-component system, response regulator RegA